MKAATIAGVASTLMFLGSTLPMVMRAARTRDVSSYSRGHLVMTNAGNAVHTVYVASLPPGPVWLLHTVYACAGAFMLTVHRRWGTSPPGGRHAEQECRSTAEPQASKTRRHASPTGRRRSRHG